MDKVGENALPSRRSVRDERGSFGWFRPSVRNDLCARAPGAWCRLGYLPALFGWGGGLSACPVVWRAQSAGAAGRPKRGSVLASKRVMAQIRVRERVRAISLAVRNSPVSGSRA